MKKDPENTRAGIMDAAQSLILDHGFEGTTVNAVIRKTGVSKGAFFHHFSSKKELGYALVKRYAEADAEHLENTFSKAEGLSGDPLQQLLIFVKLFQQEAESMEEPYPGCLFASYLHQSQLFDDEVLGIIRESMLKWRTRLMGKLKEVVQKYPPARDVELESLADMLMVVFEGSFVLSQSLNDTRVIANQLAHFHTYLSLLFRPED